MSSPSPYALWLLSSSSSKAECNSGGGRSDEYRGAFLETLSSGGFVPFICVVYERRPFLLATLVIRDERDRCPSETMGGTDRDVSGNGDGPMEDFFWGIVVRRALPPLSALLLYFRLLVGKGGPPLWSGEEGNNGLGSFVGVFSVGRPPGIAVALALVLVRLDTRRTPLARRAVRSYTVLFDP
jgi:hypothetical protein